MLCGVHLCRNLIFTLRSVFTGSVLFLVSWSSPNGHLHSALSSMVERETVVVHLRKQVLDSCRAAEISRLPVRFR